MSTPSTMTVGYADTGTETGNRSLLTHMPAQTPPASGVGSGTMRWVARLLQVAVATLPQGRMISRAASWLAFIEHHGRAPNQLRGGLPDLAYFVAVDRNLHQPLDGPEQLDAFVRARLGETFGPVTARGTNEVYSVLCIRGEPRLVWVDRERGASRERNLYTTTWQPLGVEYGFPRGRDMRRPRRLGPMLLMAGRLSAGFAFTEVAFRCQDDEVAVVGITDRPPDLRTRFSTASGEALVRDVLFGTAPLAPILA